MDSAQHYPNYCSTSTVQTFYVADVYDYKLYAEKYLPTSGANLLIGHAGKGSPQFFRLVILEAGRYVVLQV